MTVKKQVNPFMYGKPVEAEYFFQLPAFSKQVNTYIESNINVVILGARRFGKTSFLKNYLAHKRSEDCFCIEVDAFSVLSHRDFLNQFLNAVAKEKHLFGHFIDWIKQMKNLVPHIKAEMDPQSGQYSYSIGLQKLTESDVKQAINHALEGVQQLGKGKKIILSIDEFQKVGELPDSGWLEAALRTKMQDMPKVSFVFTGSRRAIIEDMFHNSKRPFYRSCTVIPFLGLGNEFSDWIIERFKIANVVCTRDVVQYLRSKVDDTPNYIQEACFHLVSQAVENVTPKDVDSVLEMISAQSSYSYEAILNNLTHAQIRLLRMLVHEKGIEYGKDVLMKYEFKTASNVQSAIRALIERQVLDKGPEKQIVFEDPMFRIWLQKKF